MPNSIKKERRAKRRQEGKITWLNPFSKTDDSKQLYLDDLIIDASQCQIRDKTTDTTVRNYATAMQNGAEFPPVLVANLNGVYHLVDGFHRIEAIKYLGIPFCQARIIEVESIEEMRYEAVKANLTNGRQLTQKEKAKALDYYIQAGKHLTGLSLAFARLSVSEGQYKSFSEIAKDLGCMSRQTVTKRNIIPKSLKRL